MKTIILVLITTAYLLPQDKKYFDAPFGGGGGYTPGWIFINMGELNNQLINFGSGQLGKSGFYTSGGAGFVYIGFIPNLRIGGMGYAGSTSTSAHSGGFNREAVYSIGGGAMTIEYTLPFVKNAAISLGAIIGGGGIDIELYRNSGDFEWLNIWDEISTSTSTNNVSRKISNNYFLFGPTFNFDFPLYRFVSLRIGGGYQLTIGKNWKIENDKELMNVPSKMNGNSFFIQSGIFLGFFSY